MQLRALLLWAGLIWATIASVARAEIKIASDVNRGEAATSEFRFESVPSPSATDAANRAKITILTGRRDSNGGSTGRLNDGKLPAEQDEPAANFFFEAGSTGGQIVFDLGEAIEVKRVNTYSWHPGMRGPQRYALYGGDANTKGSEPKPGKAVDAEAAGWKLIAKVDTGPKEGRPGGQYGVSIMESSGAAIGKYRYLLFEISRTEADDPFGNTFFSEIDIDDGRKHEPAAAPAAAPPDVITVAGKYEIAFDTSQVPEIKAWVDKTLKPVCEKWYPLIVEMLPSEGFTAPARFTIVFHAEMRGVANAGGSRINCAGPWFMQNLDGEAAGAVVHEMVHIVQQYRRGRGGNRNPGWMVEGLADYIRWFLYEPEDKRPRPNPARAQYTDSYRTTGAFLNYLVEKHDKEIVKKFNAAMREGKYSADLWKEYTGKTVDELWEEYIAELKK
jgi:hypothetical protein